MLLAGIDIGTLTCRLLIAKVQPDRQFVEVYSDRQILRLGEGVDQHHMLNDQAIERVVKTLSQWRTRIEEYRVNAIVVVATSAVREAANQTAFLAHVAHETGFEIEVLSGEEEARRTLLGIRFGLPPDVSQVLGLDIGGGSTELMLEREKVEPMVRSIDLGVVRLTERVLRNDPPTLKEISIAEDLIQDEVGKLKEVWGDLRPVTLVGTAGTVTTLAAMAQQLSCYEPARIHNFILSLGTIRGIEHELGKRSRVQRTQLPGLEKGREEVIFAGTLILRCAMGVLGFDECLVSDYGLREGILVDRASLSL